MSNEINLTGRRVCIFGLQGSGKTNFLKNTMTGIKKPLIYDPLHEYSGFHRYLPAHRDYSEESQEELNRVIRTQITEKKRGRPSFFAIDEANRYCPNRRPLPDMVEDLNDFNRHYKIALGFIARRPTQLNTDLVELAHYLIIYNLTGKNDYQYLEAISEGLGDAVRALPKYHYVLVHPDRSYKICQPVADMGATGSNL